jgi:hypothetical protein
MKIEPARNPLRRARLAARLELRDLEVRTRISPAMLRHMDEGEFHRLPAGIYARSWVRTVALAVGLDPSETLRELEHALPRAAENPSGESRSTDDGPNDPPSPDGGRGSLPHRPAVGFVAPLLDRWRRSAVAVLDGIFLAGISIAVWMLTAAAAGVDPGALGPAGALAVAAIAVAVGAAYFVLFAGIGGRTPGAALFGCPAVEGQAPLELAEIGRRAAASALQESSIIVDFMIEAEFPPTVEHRGVRA